MVPDQRVDRYGKLGILADIRAAETDRPLLIVFFQMASILTVLHNEGYFIPHLILNDIMLVKEVIAESLRSKLTISFHASSIPNSTVPPMLEKLLNCHPDIVNQRPLDFRSDIWSLAKFL